MVGGVGGGGRGATGGGVALAKQRILRYIV